MSKKKERIAKQLARGKLDKRIAVLALPRSGTHFIHFVAKQFCMNIGHEMLEKDGAVDWRILLVVEDILKEYVARGECYYGKNEDAPQAVPAGEVPQLGGPGTRHISDDWSWADEDELFLKVYLATDWAHIIHVIRDPFNVISTYAQLYDFPTAGGAMQPLVFFTKSCKRPFDFQNAIERGAMIYLEYNKRMEAVSSATLKIENIVAELRDHFLSSDFSLRPAARPGSAPTDARMRDMLARIQRWGPETVKGIAVSADPKDYAETPYSKKRLTHQEIKDAISNELWNELVEYANKHDYQANV
jgi:hypothetical protein